MIHSQEPIGFIPSIYKKSMCQPVKNKGLIVKSFEPRNTIRRFKYTTYQIIMILQYLPNFSATTSARLTAFLLFSLFLLSLHHFPFDHFNKISHQMQSTLITENSIKFEPIVILSTATDEGGEYYEFDDDGEEEFELYNDEDFY